MSFKEIADTVENIIDAMEEEIIKRSGSYNYNNITIQLTSAVSVENGIKNFTGEITVRDINVVNRVEEDFIPPIEMINFNDIYNYNEYRNAVRNIFNYEVLTENNSGIMTTTWVVSREEAINIIREFKRQQYYAF